MCLVLLETSRCPHRAWAMAAASAQDARRATPLGLCDLVEVEQINPARCLPGLFNPREAYGTRLALMSSSAQISSAGSMLQGGNPTVIKFFCKVI